MLFFVSFRLASSGVQYREIYRQVTRNGSPSIHRTIGHVVILSCNYNVDYSIIKKKLLLLT